MDTFTFVFLRFLVAALTMLAVMFLTKRFSGNFNKRLVVFLGVTNGAAYLLQYIGMVYAFASKSSLFVNLSVVWVALLSPLILKEKIGRKKVGGLIVSLMGIVLMTTNLDFASFGDGEFFWDLLVIVAGIIWAVFIVYNKLVAADHENFVTSATWVLLFTMLPLLPIVSFSAANFFSLPWEAWIAIFYTAIFCWVLPYYLWTKGLKDISPFTSTVILLNEIVVATIISLVVLGEVMTIVSAIGAIFIVAAILLVSYR